MRTVLLLLALLLPATPALAAWARFQNAAAVAASSDPTAGVLPAYDDAYLNWTNAGLASVGGIAAHEPSTQCGATLTPSGGDDTSNIQTAINNCPTGEYVQLGAGNFLTSWVNDQPIRINRSVVLRGYGSCTGSSSGGGVSGGSPLCPTAIVVNDGALAYAHSSVSVAYCGTNLSNIISCPNGNPAQSAVVMQPGTSYYDWSWANCGSFTNLPYGCGATPLAADAAAGQTTIHVSSTSGFSAGQFVLIDEASGAGWIPDPMGSGTASPFQGCTNVWAEPDTLASSGSPATGRFVLPKGSNCYWGGSWDIGPTAIATSGGAYCWFTYCDRLASEIHKIASVNAGASTITFDDPLTIAFRVAGPISFNGAVAANSNLVLTGQLTWGGGGCSGTGQTPPILNVTTSAANGGVASVTSIAAAGNCGTLPPNGVANWYVSGGSLETIGSGAAFNLVSNGSGGVASATVATAGTDYSPATLTTTSDSCQMIAGQIVSGSGLHAGQYVTAVNSCGGGNGSYALLHSESSAIAAEAMTGAAHEAQVYLPGDGAGGVRTMLQYAGIENLSILRGPSGGLFIQFCAYCWAKNVDVAEWYGGGIDVKDSIRTQLDTVYVHHSWNSQSNGGEYPIAFDHAATEDLLTNSITNFAGKGMVFRSGGAGSVVSYSYQDDTMYDAWSGGQGNGDYWVDMGVNASHMVGPHHVLFEGNWGDNLDSDSTHGASIYVTFFRNNGSGLRTTFIDPSIPYTACGLVGTVNDFAGLAYTVDSSGPASCYANAPAALRAAGPAQYSYWFAFVGNVLGVSGKTTSGNGWSYQGNASLGTPYIWRLGWAAGNLGQDAYIDGASGSYIFQHGDYDYVNGSIVDWTGGYSHTLPNSFYLASQPSFFSAGAACSYPWPWVTPTGGSPLTTPSGGGSCSSYSGLPAKARWMAGTPFVQP